jgi:serine/threonine protein kinase
MNKINESEQAQAQGADLLFLILSKHLAYIDDNDFLSAVRAESLGGCLAFREFLLRSNILSSTQEKSINQITELLLLQNDLDRQGLLRLALTPTVLDELVDIDEKYLPYKEIKPQKNGHKSFDSLVLKCLASQVGENDPDDTSFFSSASKLAARDNFNQDFEIIETSAGEASEFMEIQLSERYKKLELLGEGGLGQVWKAYDNILKREVAIKCLKPKGIHDPAIKERFIREAFVTGQLEHPSIVSLYDAYYDEETQSPVYSMMMIRGENFKDRIDRYHEGLKSGKKDGLELRRLMGAVVNTCHAIAHAHSRGIIHRDLKPENIVIGRFGGVIVLDWGVAKLINDPENDDSRTISEEQVGAIDETAVGAVVGTPAYMAPEQARGKAAEIDQRTDVFGLGAILFYVLTGRSPHTGESFEEMVKMVQNLQPFDTKSINSDIPRPMAAIVEKALAPQKSDRYQTPMDLVDDIQRFLADEPVSSYQPKIIENVIAGKLFKESHHTEVTESHGFIWLCQSAVYFVIFLSNYLLLNMGYTSFTPHVLVWLVGLVALVAPAWHYRIRSGPGATFVEQKLIRVVGLFLLAIVLTGIVHFLAGKSIEGFIALIALEACLFFGTISVILNGEFFFASILCGISGIVAAFGVPWASLVVGASLSLSTLLPGIKYGLIKNKKSQ